MIIEELKGYKWEDGGKDGSTVDALFSSLHTLPSPFLLESASPGRHACGRYTFMGGDPFILFESSGRRVRVVEKGDSSEWEGDPFTELERLLVRYGDSSHPALPFHGGAVGYIGYEAANLLESLPLPKADSVSLPDMRFGFYDTVVIIDHLEHKAYLSSTGFPESGAGRAKRAGKRFHYFMDVLSRKAEGEAARPVVGELSPNFTRKKYCETVRRIKRYIEAGDIYQANLSQRFTASFSGSKYLFYRDLNKVNPVPFSAFLIYPDLAVISNSPERLLSLRDGRLETRPIKGTIRRGRDDREDNIRISQLKDSAKDGAEHVMIVDLARNDLGRVCRYGTVRVDALKEIESFSNLHHMVSTVSGRVKEGTGPVDCIRAAFPGGSITGAPKVRAMEIIREVEPNPRWIYTGAIGYIGFDGGMDLNIAIRTAFVKEGRLFFSVGGGIVADSDPMSEYEESLLKGEVFQKVSRGRER